MGPSEPACQLENVALPVPQECRAMARSFLMPGQAEGDGGSSRGLRAESPGHGAHSSQPRHCRPLFIIWVPTKPWYMLMPGAPVTGQKAA